MALNYAKLFNGRATRQSQPIPGSTQVANSGGGYSWQVDDWTRFDRFLSPGSQSFPLGGETGSRLAYTQQSEGQHLPERPFPFASWCNQERVGL
jgi:hypothetical protein